MTEKKCPFNSRTLMWIIGLSFLIPCVFWCIRTLLAPAPVFGTLIIMALFAGVVYCLIKRPAWIKKSFPNGERFIDWANKEENEPRVVFGFLLFLAALGFIAASLIIPEATNERDAMIQSAIAEGARPVSIDGYCINGTVYVKDSKGKYAVFELNGESVACDKNRETGQ